MESEANPYESPAALSAEESAPSIRRPAFGTFLIGLWILEGAFKAYLLGAGFLKGFNPLQYLADDYHTWNPIIFFLVASFFIIETIGPWIGVYYLTGRRSRTISFDKAIERILKVAGGVTIVLSSVLTIYLELTAPIP
jgi:hypothetical protein